MSSTWACSAHSARVRLNVKLPCLGWRLKTETPCGHPQLRMLCADLLIQRCRLGRWLDAEIGGQDLSIPFILSERRAALPVQRQDTYKLILSFLQPGVERDAAL